MTIYYLRIKEDYFDKEVDAVQLRISEVITPYEGEISYVSEFTPYIHIRIPNEGAWGKLEEELLKIDFIDKIEGSGNVRTLS